MDFIDECSNGLAPVESEVTFRGKTGVMYFKRITGFQKLQLVKGKKFKYDTTEGAPQVLDVDLEDNEKNQHLIILFCVCNPDGSPRFKKLEEVQKLDSGLLAALYAAANKVNAESEKPGEA